jgi:hypothetical protein
MVRTLAGFENAELRSKDQLPPLAEGKVWMGDGDNRPAEITLADENAKYIVKAPSPSLPNAQSLSTLQSGMLKVHVENGEGTLQNAVPDTDYVTWNTFFNFKSLLDSLVSVVGTVSSGIESGIAILTAIQGSVSTALTVLEASIAALGTGMAAVVANLLALDIIIQGKATKEAEYILGKADANLPNAQALDALSDGLLKHSNGIVETAVDGVDYVSEDTAFMYALMF